MLEISPAKVAHVIVKARQLDAKVASWDESSSSTGIDNDADTILEDHISDATRSELEEFISGLNEDEQAHLVALAWVGRGTYNADDFAEAVSTARSERTVPTEQYLLGIPLLADYLEGGLDNMGYSVESAEDGIL